MNKRQIGYIALVVAAISLVVWILLISTGSVFDGGGFSPIVPVVLFAWIGGVVTAIACLAGDVIKYFAKKAGEGYRSGYQPDSVQNVQYATGFCPHCGKPLTSKTPFCPNCGNKL